MHSESVAGGGAAAADGDDDKLVRVSWDDSDSIAYVRSGAFIPGEMMHDASLQFQARIT